MGSVTDHLNRLAPELKLAERLETGGNVQVQKGPSGKGKGKWQNKASLAKYRKKRDAKRRG
jgi:hypothetical protein